MRKIFGFGLFFWVAACLAATVALTFPGILTAIIDKGGSGNSGSGDD